MPTLSKNIIISVALALAAAAALVLYVEQVRDQASSGQRTVSVVVATHPIATGTTVDDAISAGDFGQRTMRAADVPNLAVQSLDAIRGQVVTQDLYPGDTVTQNRLGAAQGQSASYRVTGIFRLVRVPLFPAQGLLDDVQEGDRVDVFALASNADGSKHWERLIVPGALVKGITPLSDTAGSNDQGSLLLSVTEQQAALIAAALAADTSGHSDNNIWFAVAGRKNATYTTVAPVPVSR
jgi:Flp pilus assembly protein CpaB